MAEAVRPPRRAKAKASRTKTKEKKRSETLQREESDEVSLPKTSRELEIPTPACGFKGDCLKVLTDSQLQNAASGQNESEMFDVPLTSLTISDEGSLTWNTETLKEGEEVRACVGDDAVKLKFDPGDNVGTKVEAPKNFTEVEENKLVQCGPSESTLQSNFSYTQQEMENLQVRETQKKKDKQALGFSSEVLQNVPLQSSCEAKDIFQPPRVKKLYPQLPAEIAREAPGLVAAKPLFRNERLYPELPSQPELVPFTKEQLKIFEPGSWLENVESYLEEFDSMAHQDRHEFYELLLNYSRCRKQLLLAEAELLALTSDCQNAKSRLWHFKDEQLSMQGICADQVKVSGYHRYQRVEMNENALGELKKLFDAKSEHLHQTLALHSYTSVLSKLQVESYIYALLSGSALLRSFAIQGRACKQTESFPSDLCQLKECISVLFMFTRRVNEDTQFHDDILLWLQKLVSVLQRVGCPGDHFFLLNHILRCPAGVSEWAVPFIQIKVLNNPSGVFHFMQSLALLMSPVKNRAEFLCHMKPSEQKPSSSGPASGTWTLVDEGGEEDEDPETSWLLLNEDDLVILLSQFPFHELFQHLLGFKAKGDYSPETTRPQEMMKIFAFANSLVELLAVGLETFNRARYRQFVKRVGYMIRMTLGYVSDHWAQFVSHNRGLGLAQQPYSMEKLQVEFDELFLRAVLHVLKAKRLGIWLFMSEMPFGTLSVQMLWKLFYLMHQVESGNLEKLCVTLPPAECKKQLQDPEHFVNFEKCLSSMNSSEEICLLTTFAQMAQARRTNVDEDFIKIIVLEIYEVSYVTLSTRETFSKVGRELLGAITAVHPEIISIILDRVQDTIDQVGMVSLYLFKELPLYLWRPSASERAVIRDWLLNYNLAMVKNKLACVILEGLNWGFGEQGTLHLDQAVHAEVALMILEAYQKYLAQKPYAGLLSESMKQVSYLASIVRYGETPETSFNQWAWNLILRLKLHKNDYGIQQNCPTVPFSSTVPEMTESPTFHPLLKAVKAGMPIGCYLALAMTTVGHRYSNALGYHCDRSLLSSLVSWIVAGNITPSFVEGLATPTQVWFAWTVLNMESIFEEDSQLRRVVEGELVINSAFTPDQALKKAQAQLKLPIVPSLQRLLIYRWAHQALVTPSDHPLLPLIWQKFFLLYLHRPGPQYGLPIDGCIGRRFFQSPAHISLLKEMKRRLTEVADFHHAASKALRVPAEGSEGPPASQAGTPGYLTSPELHTELIFSILLKTKERVLSNLRKHEAPQPPLDLHPVRPPVPVISSAVLLSQKDATQLVRTDLNVLQQQARTAALRESQQVALESELLDTMPKQYVNREEQATLHLECRGSSGKKCQGPAVVTVQFEGMHKNEAISQQLHVLRKEVKQLQAEAAKPPSLNTVEAAVHAENLITALVNAYKLQPTPGVQKVGISLFFTVVDYVSDETQRHPPTRQFFTSCIEILGQVFISGTKSECRKVLETVLKNRRLCSLLSPFFTPNAAPAEFIQLYEKVVKFLSEDNSDMIFMLLTKFNLKQWLNTTKPPLSDRTRLLESIHLALTAWGLEPDEDILMPFNLFCKHWTYLLLYQFPDQYSDILRLLMQSSAEQLLSPECWKATLRALGCCAPNCQQGAASAESSVLQSSPDVLLSDKQVVETIQWLSNFFYKLRLSTLDFKSFGLFSKWSPYMADMKTLLGYLVKRLLDSEMACLAQDPFPSSKTVLRSLHSVIIQLFKPWILVLEDHESSQRHYPWLESDAVVALSIVQLFTDCIDSLHESFKDKLLPSDEGALRLHLMHYCEACTAPRMPEFILYAFHSAYRRLPWRDLHPDQMLMEAFFKVERGSPKSCFLFLGSVLCEVNWVSVLSDAWSPSPHPETRSMIVCLLFMMILLAKEDQLVDQADSPLLNLLGQTSSLSWHLVDTVSYQSVLSYFSSHYQPAIILAKESSAELIMKLLRVSAGLSIPTDSQKHLDAVPKCRAFTHQMVQFLSSLEQNGKITLAVLEKEMSKLLDDIIVFNPPDMDSQTRHMALSSLFMEVLMMMNNATIPTAEFLRGSVRTWIGQKVHGLVVLPLLTAACQSLASVRHMAETTEACITAYFKEGSLNQNLGWGPILVSLQVPELTIEEFLQECLSLGSYLTLYVYLLQCLNSEQTLRNDMKVLLILSKWLEQVYPSSTQEEAKLFLWWHQVLQLSLIQAEQSDSVLIESVVRILLMLQSRLSLLAEERLSSGILGAIGLGRKSPLSNRFRVVARGMAAFLSVQVPSEDQIRLKPGTELHLTPKAQQALTALESLTSNKQYVEYQDQISQAAQFIKHPGHCLQDGKSFLALLVNCLYPEVHYLDNIR
ncbi:ectopic P granules protein 5 homolog [Leptonychotes weddellii]|uniref:Ectopic P granules protein 5 homolog n=1 Tax=Leptonychotes weddellii TaxID=9713 RepID=A0A7F8RJQ0_LEPWE|nr:ectopic P granules protein 5 homolog [Leptonychotes weddellii]